MKNVVPSARRQSEAIRRMVVAAMLSAITAVLTFTCLLYTSRRFFESEDDVPRQAISLGIGSIMNARRILLLATGADKAEAIRNAVYGDINPRTQASILRTHSNVIFLLDKAAAGLL